MAKKEPQKMPPGRHRFGGLMGDVEKRVVAFLGGPTKALVFLVGFYLKFKHLSEEEDRKLKEQLKRL